VYICLHNIYINLPIFSKQEIVSFTNRTTNIIQKRRNTKITESGPCGTSDTIDKKEIGTKYMN
jgi:hypothetical protein